MTIKEKTSASKHKTALNISNNGSNSANLRYRLLSVVTTLTVWGWFPISLTNWLSNRGGSRDD